MPFARRSHPTSATPAGRAAALAARRPRAGSSRSSAGDIREWAKANGFEVSERGRISSEVREAYASAH